MEAAFLVDGEDQPILPAESGAGQCGSDNRYKDAAQDAVVVGSGKEALRALQRETFDLVLMDVQMPEMNGLAAVAIIREREQVTGGHVPIVALTAHAMKDDRDRCLAAGMNAYVSKPLRAQERFAAIASLFPARAEEAPAASMPVAPTELLSAREEAAGAAPGGEQDGDPVFDRETALSRIEGDAELLRRMAKLLAPQSAKLLVEIGKAVRVREGKRLPGLLLSCLRSAFRFSPLGAPFRQPYQSPGFQVRRFLLGDPFLGGLLLVHFRLRCGQRLDGSGPG
jgi:CheY-like chemotaxis protein